MADETTGATAVVEAPSSTTAVPSTSTSSTVAAERPTSFAEAMARVGKTATPDPGVAKPASAEPVAATALPPQSETPPAETAPPPETQGPIPFVNHKRILENARTKTEQEVTQRLQEQYRPHVELFEKFRTDPVGSTEQAIQELLAHPQYGQQIISALARTLGSRRNANPPAEAVSEEPPADYQGPDGSQFYSASTLAKIRAYDRQQILQEVDQKLQPVLTREQQHVATEREAQAKLDASARMSKVLAPYQALPEFTEHLPAIREKTAALIKEGHGAETALGLAVTHVLREVVLPGRAAQSRNALVAEAVKKSTGSTSTAGASPAAPASRPKDFADAYSRIAI